MGDGRLRILDHAWHQVHSYRLHALPVDFWFYRVGWRSWNDSIRPEPPNLKGLIYKYDPGDFDLILTHLDQWCDERYQLRGMPYRIMNLTANRRSPETPRICIMHGSPDNAANRLRILRLLENTPGGAPFLVCNSKQAWREWGLGAERSRPIIHGYDVDEFWSHKARSAVAISVCGGGTMSREYHGIPLLERIRREVPLIWIGTNGYVPTFSSYDQYRDALASTMIYVHTGQRAPMSGARTEAMLSGCCVVSTDNHDAADYIEHGHTGFLTNDADEMIAIIKELLDEPKRAYQIGKRGREAARIHFDRDRFVRDWLDLLGGLGVRV